MTFFLSAISLQTILVAMVILNLIGLSIAAFILFRKK
jgi:hypothetical protein